MITQPPLTGLQEIQQRLGLSHRRIQQLSGRAGFPPPHQTLAMGRVRRPDEIETWIRRHRPARVRLDVEELGRPGGQ